MISPFVGLSTMPSGYASCGGNAAYHLMELPVGNWVPVGAAPKRGGVTTTKDEAETQRQETEQQRWQLNVHKTPQDTFLNNVRKNKIPLTIFLVNGVKLQGVVTWFDNFCVLLRRDGHSQLVYKHAISTIMPGIPLRCSKAPKNRCEDKA